MKATKMSTVKVKKEPVKVEPVKKEKKQPKPIVIDEVSAEKFQVKKFFEKRAYKGIPVPLADGHVRCEILKECDGMTSWYSIGDIVDLPDRRYKSMLFRGLVKKYEGDNVPNKDR